MSSTILSFVIYNTETKHRFRSPTGMSSWATERTAKSTLTKMIKAGVLKQGQWKVALYDHWAEDDHMVTVKNCLSGKEVQIRASQRGNPAVDPSMEGYHCM